MNALHHLLRTFASVPAGGAVLVAEEASFEHSTALRLMGFSVETARVSPPFSDLPFPDDSFGWVVTAGVLDACSHAERLVSLRELRRVLEPGGWLYIVVTDRLAPDDLTAWMADAGLVVAERAAEDALGSLPVVRGIYRRVESGSIG